MNEYQCCRKVGGVPGRLADLPLLWTEGAPLYGYPVWLLVADICAKSILFTLIFVRTRESVLIAVLLHASSNLFAVSPAIISDPAFAILATIAKWLLVIICLALTHLQTKPDQAPPAARPVSPNSDD